MTREKKKGVISTFGVGRYGGDRLGCGRTSKRNSLHKRNRDIQQDRLRAIL